MRFRLPGLIAAVTLSIATAPAFADDADLPPVDYPAIPVTVAARSELVPPGWKLEAEAAGDLNGDRRADLVLVIQSEKPDLASSGKPLRGPRMLIIAFGAANSGARGYDGVVADHQLIPRSDNAYLDDCFDAESGGLSIKRGKLVVALNFFASAGGWSMWTKTFTFAWKNDRMMLTRFDYDNIDRKDGDMTLAVADYGSKTLKVTRGNNDTDKTTTRKSKLPGPSSLSLQQVGDGMDFNAMPEE